MRWLRVGFRGKRWRTERGWELSWKDGGREKMGGMDRGREKREGWTEEGKEKVYDQTRMRKHKLA